MELIDYSNAFECGESLAGLFLECLPFKVDPYCDPKSDSDPNPPHAPRYMAGGMKYEHAPMVTMEFGLFLYSLIRYNKYQSIVETGTCHGNSSAWIAGALKDNNIPGLLTTYDILVENPNPNDLWQRLGLSDRIRFVNDTIWADVFKVPEEIDLAFVDSQHNYETILKEMDIIWPRVRRGGLVIFHDYTLYPEVRHLMRGYGSNLIFPLGRGCLVTQKP